MLEVLDQLLAAIPGLDVEVDRWGNRIVLLRRDLIAKGVPPLVFVAHVDHPGFVFRDHQKGATLKGTFEGRVFDEYFPGSPVRVFCNAKETGTRGFITFSTPRSGEDNNRQITLQLEQEVDSPVLAMWDVPAFSLSELPEVGTVINGRACDDLCGVAAMLTALGRLSPMSSELIQPIMMIFSRAEETGFCGTLCLLDENAEKAILPENAKIVSVEISSETESIKIGEGAVLRVGDKAGVFDSQLLSTLWNTLNVEPINPELKVRRALMDKGTCEATAFSAYGFQTSGICAPVRGYHNMQSGSTKIVCEQVALNDLLSLMQMIIEFSTSPLFAEEKFSMKEQMQELLTRGKRQLNLKTTDKMTI